MRIGIFGGTFNPVHLGHIKAAGESVALLGLDKLIIVPASVPPHKQIPADAPGFETRMEMLRLCFDNFPEAEISDVEIKRAGVSYTADTLDGFRAEYGGAELYLMVGGDMFLTLETWYRARDIFASAVIAVFARADERDSILEHAAKLKKEFRANVRYIETKPIEISSSALRESLKKRGGCGYLPDRLYSYIIKNRLYGAMPDWDWLRSKALAMHDASRAAHVLGTEEEAVRLAEKWGADADDARCAAILHDITKKLSVNEQLLLCEKYAIIADNVEKIADKLLHSKTAAAIAAHEFGVSSPVEDAIRWHTTGRRGMTLLEKVIYIADYIEKTRNFDGVDMLRELAYSDINRAIELGLEMSIEDIKSRGTVIHPNTLEAYEFIRQTTQQ